MTQTSIVAISAENFRVEPARRTFGRPSSPWRTMAFMIAGLLSLFWSTISFGQNAREFAREGFAAKERREYPLAVRLFNEALMQGQSTPEQRGFILYGRGVAYEALGLRDLALGDFDAAIALLPDFPNSYVYRALVWVDRRQFDKARDDLQQALRLNPNSALIHNNLGSIAERKGEIDRAIDSYGEAIRLAPKYAQAFYNRAHAYMAKRDYRSAITDYGRAIDLQRDFADAWSNRGGMYLLLGGNRQRDPGLRRGHPPQRLRSDLLVQQGERADRTRAL